MRLNDLRRASRKPGRVFLSERCAANGAPRRRVSSLPLRDLRSSPAARHGFRHLRDPERRCRWRTPDRKRPDEDNTDVSRSHGSIHVFRRSLDAPSRIRAARSLAVLSVTSGPGPSLSARARNRPLPPRRSTSTPPPRSSSTYLPRIGSKVADLIVERRKEKPFARPEELMEVKGIGEKLFLTLKPYVSITGPTTLDVQGSSLLLFSPPASSPAGGQGEARQRRPGGQGTVTPPPARGPQGPGPPFDRRRHGAARARPRARPRPCFAVLIAAPGALPLRQSVSVRSAVHETTVAFFLARSYAISRGPQRRPEVPQERRSLGMGSLRRWKRKRRPHGRDRERRRSFPRGLLSLVAQRRAARDHDGHPGARPREPPGRYLDRIDDPIRFNNSDICSFSPIGESTPGSVYLWDAHDRMAVVRVFGQTAKVRTLFYRRGERGWKR